MNKYEALQELSKKIKNMPDEEFFQLAEELDKEVWGIDSISNEAVDYFLSNIDNEDISYRKIIKKEPIPSISAKINIYFIYGDLAENLTLISSLYNISNQTQDIFIINEDEGLAA